MSVGGVSIRFVRQPPMQTDAVVSMEIVGLVSGRDDIVTIFTIDIVIKGEDSAGVVLGDFVIKPIALRSSGTNRVTRARQVVYLRSHIKHGGK